MWSSWPFHVFLSRALKGRLVAGPGTHGGERVLLKQAQSAQKPGTNGEAHSWLVFSLRASWTYGSAMLRSDQCAGRVSSGRIFPKLRILHRRGGGGKREVHFLVVQNRVLKSESFSSCCPVGGLCRRCLAIGSARYQAGREASNRPSLSSSVGLTWNGNSGACSPGGALERQRKRHVSLPCSTESCRNHGKNLNESKCYQEMLCTTFRALPLF